MPRTNTSVYAILGLLAQGARTGYDIRQSCEEALVHFWSESYGQIYPNLHRLEAEGWVERETVGGDGPTRHLYQLTHEGRAALRAWIGEAPQPLRVRNELLLKVFLGRHAEPEALQSVLRSFEEGVAEKRRRLAELRRLIEGEDPPSPDAPYWLLTLDFGLRSLEAQAAWVQGALEVLAAENGS